MQAAIVAALNAKGSDIASATTTDLSATNGLFHDITGTTTITGFGTVRAGIWKVLKYEGALTLTHNATSLILLGGANRTTADGDVQIVASEGSGNWREWAYFRAAALFITPTSTDTLTNKTLTSPTLTTPTLNGALAGDAIAAQAEMETGTATDSIVSPGRQHFHQSAVKGWVMADTAAGVAAGYNVTSVTDNGAGDASINWATDFSSALYCAVASSKAGSGTSIYGAVDNTSFAAGVTRVYTATSTTGSLTDPNNYMCAVLGDQ
jgi:hypothetical protein